MTRRILAALAGGVLALTGPATLAATPPPAAAVPAADGRAPEDTAPAAEFQQVALAKGEAEMGEPMSLAVLPDLSVLHTSRDGTVRRTDAAGATEVVGALDVYAHDEEGLQGIGVDPDFEENRFIYLFYAPPLDTPAGDAPTEGAPEDFAPFEGVNRLSRFVLDEDHRIDLASETTILDVPASRGQCCHVGGDIDFDAEGNLYLSTGDDTNPFASDGYTPIDERAERNPVFDAQRTSANTDDLRGKVLRITVGEDGGYTIPPGNLFAEGTEGTRPEIYAMGFRNPFRMSVDRATGVVYVGDYGPDAGAASPSRGPGGQVEFNRITGPGNFGWPYCTGDNDAYVDYDFADGSSGATFDCAAPVNESPHNTGLTELPPAQPAWIPYDGTSVPEFGGGSESPMAGPVYRYDPGLDSDVKFPEAYDGHFFATEYGRRWIRNIDLEADGTINSINEFPWSGTQVMDSAFGPDGALYVLDYGTGYFSGDENSALYRIEHVTDGRSPVAEASGAPTSGPAPLAVAFSSEGSGDPDGDAITYAWDFGDGATSTEPHPTHTYEENGDYTAELTVTDATGRTGSASVPVTVGNTAPTVELVLPAAGQLVDFGDAVPFEIEVSDPEDGAIDCSRVTLSFVLGHDSHGHKLTETTGCSGTLQTLADGEHDPNANIFGIFDAEYTDAGGLTTHHQVITQTRTRQAEHFGDSSGVEISEHATAHGGRAVGWVDDGDWIAFTPYLLSDATEFTARVASGGAGGTIEIRADSPTGPLLGSVDVAPTGGWNVYEDVTTALTDPPDGTIALHLVLTGPTGRGALFDIDDFTFGTGSP
ncbi:PQQ-dependent sugar dehydrogenase [Streptomyces marincola]|uniref:Glycosyl hydrolase n=1 Tax=Streptomyces marincola TaxID=2878388 RepID=A0A1W7CV35_9ACTN|nr:glycosyl hydrolase [Streptomyces marincola]